MCGEGIRLAQERYKCRALMDIVMNFRGSIKRGEFLNYLQTYQPYKKDSAMRELSFRSGFTNRVIS